MLLISRYTLYLSTLLQVHTFVINVKTHINRIQFASNEAIMS